MTLFDSNRALGRSWRDDLIFVLKLVDDDGRLRDD